MSRATILAALAACGGAALLVSLVLTRLAISISRRIGFVDRPGAHKSHDAPTPYGGGVAIFLAGWLPVALGALAAVWLSPEWAAAQFGEGVRPYWGGLSQRAASALALAGGALILQVLGLIDDARPLGAYSKLVIITLVSLGAVLIGGVRIGVMWGPLMSACLTTAWFIVIINAFNFLDNMDGLSAGVAWICLAFVGICGLMSGQLFVPALACLFLGAIGGFWVYNFPPARIFMGDAGSLVIGYMLAVVSALTTYYESGTGAPPYALAMPLVILAIPLYDCFSVVTIRLSEGRSPFRGDQRHFSHRLVDRGLTRRQAVLTIYLAAATTGLAATLLPGADLRRTLTIGVLVLMVLAIVAILESPLRRKT